MATVCAKRCTMEEIRQMEATRKERPTKEIGGERFEQARNEMEIRRIAIDNWKAELKTEINGSAMEKYTDEASISQVASEKASGKFYRKPVNPKDFNEIYNPNDPIPEVIDRNIKTIDSGNYEFQKEIGERQAECIMIQELGMEVVAFDKKNTGFDNIGIYICKDKSDCLVIVEAKCTQSKDGRSNLETDKNLYKQAEKPWVIDRLNSMKDPESKLYSENNAKFAEEALKKMKGDNLDRYVIHTNVNTLNIIVSKAHNDEDWQYHSAYRSLKR